MSREIWVVERKGKDKKWKPAPDFQTLESKKSADTWMIGADKRVWRVQRYIPAEEGENK